MEKTVVIVCGNSLSAAQGGEQITLDVKLGVRHGPGPKIITKTLWTCCVEAVTEYCRIIFDLFPDDYQVCVAAADEVKCHPINTWRDEDQELTKVQFGFQKFGCPALQLPVTAHPRNHMTSILQGLQFGMRCLAQLTATQYAASISQPSVRKSTSNKGRIVLFCCLKGIADIKEIEKTALNLLHVENSDIKQKHDPARLAIQKCDVVVVNTYGSLVPADIIAVPSYTLFSDLSMSVHSYFSNQLMYKSIELVKTHFGLKSTLISNIPMKEEQSGGGSFNYDVELVHDADAHRDIFRSGYIPGSTGMSQGGRESDKDAVILRWSTPKSMNLDLQYCSSVYRVTPADVTSRPTICLVNFVLSGKPVLLEQPRKNSSGKIISHLLTCHGGGIFLHCLPGGRTYLDDPPSISEGWGGRITDYRISDFGQLIQDNMLTPQPVERTKIPTVYPIQMATVNLERQTRHWPMVFGDTVAFSMTQELEPLLSIIHNPVLSEVEVEECKKVIMSLQLREENNEPLPIPSSGTRTKGSKRDEQYNLLWNELETITDKYRELSEHHRMLYDFVCHAASQSPSSQSSRLNQTVKDEPMELETKIKEQSLVTSGKSSQLPSWNKGSRNTPYPIPAKPVASLLSIWTTQLNAKASAGHPDFKGRIVSQTNRADLYSFMKSNNDSVISLGDQDI